MHMRTRGPLPVTTLRMFAVTMFAGLIMFGCVLRFRKLTGVGLWYDELWTVVGASNRPFMEMYREWILGDAHPPGFFLFYYGWFKIFPNTEFWARLPNAVAGVGTVLYLLFGTRGVLARDERIMSAAFVSLSYIYIFYSLSVKQYSVVILLATIATVRYLAITNEGHIDRRAGIALSATCLALAYLNHFGMVYASMLLVLLTAAFWRNRDQLRRVGRIAAVFAIGYLPIAYFLYVQVAYSIDDWQPYDVSAFLSSLLPTLFFDDQRSVLAALIILSGLVIALGIAGRPPVRQMLTSSRNRRLAVIVVAFASCMLALGISKPIFYVRYFIVLWPAVLMGLGIVTAAVFHIDAGWPAILPLAFFLRAAAIDFQSVEGLQREEWDKSVDLVLASKQPQDGIYVLGAPTNKTAFDYLRAGDVSGAFFVRNVKFYEYYFRRRGATQIAATLEVVEPTVESVRNLTERFRGTGMTIYVLAGHNIEYEGEALEALQRAARRVEITPLVSTVVYRMTF
jgi:mannosyltransferase